MPLLSIIIPSYNYAHYLPTAIESVLNQDYRDYELIIVDDASTDHSLDVAKDYQKQDSRIRIIEHKKNRGLFYGFNEGLDAAKGTYFHGLSADDCYLPGFLSKTMNLLLAHPEIGLAFSDSGHFYDHSVKKIEKTRCLPGQKSPLLIPANEMVEMFKKRGIWIPGHTCIAKKELAIAHGYLQPKFNALADWFLFASIAFDAGMIYIPKVLAATRFHPNTFSNDFQVNRQKKRLAYHALLKEAASDKERWKKSGLLGFVFRDPIFWLTPKYWSLLPYALIKKLHALYRTATSTSGRTDPLYRAEPHDSPPQ